MQDNQFTLNIGIVAEFKIADKPVEIKLEKVGNDFSLLKANISTKETFKIRDIVKAVDEELGSSLPEELQVTFEDILWIIECGDNNSNPKQKSKFLISLDVDTNIDFSNLPLVGKKLPVTQVPKLDKIQLLFASDSFKSLPSISGLTKKELVKGLNLSAFIEFDQVPQVLDLPVEEKTNNENQNNAISTEPSNIKWFDLKKKLGPLYLARIGLKYQNSEIWILLDASLSAAGLTLTLVGLSIGFALKDITNQQFKPKFNLQGLGVNFKSSGAIEIGGTFIHSKIKEGDKERDDYSGALIIKTETFTITAIGSYTEIEGQPSIFIYGILDKPIGGPPFFFVTGLALGFAYNRSLILPTLDKIADFPLIEAAYSNTPPNLSELNKIQTKLNPYIPPKIGDIVLAIGIRFTSFKIIDTFALLVANFGNEFSLSLLGISTITSPPNIPGTPTTVPPLVQVRFVILARFVPSEGTLKVDGKILPDSYLFDKKCQLSGGFAFYSWFKGEHEGDFVLTLGGYHPDFNVPAHYPKVDPLQLNWQINSELSIKGSVYFALTSAAIMAGGRLEAVWQSGDLKAWFIANANFIVAWQPYYYDAQISLRIGASYTFSIKIFKWRIHKTISVEVGADLHIWGPEFAGTATVDLSIISFTIRFGNQSKAKPPALLWDEFKKSFLPKDKDVCSIAFESGLTRKLGEGESAIWVVNPKEFCLITNSVIPIKTSNVITGNYSHDVGIAPMDIKSEMFSISLYEVKVYQIVIDKEKKEEKQGKNQYFKFEAIKKNVPSGLWGQSKEPNLNSTVISDVLSGFTIKPATPPKPGTTKALALDKLLYEQNSNKNPYNWESFSKPLVQKGHSIKIKDNLSDKKSERKTLLQSLGVAQDDIDQIDLREMSENFDQAFIKNPELTFTLPT